MRVVTPFKPFAPESPAHRKLGEFDWPGAIRMLRHSVAASNRIETVVLTDLTSDVPGPSFRYDTRSRRLMLWILEVACCYIESDDFDQDTVMMSPDLLAFGDLSRFLGDWDLGVLLRHAGHKRPVLNAVQFWRPRRRDALARAYRQLYDAAGQLPDNWIKWGGDTKPFCDLLAPLSHGVHHRIGIDVCFLPAQSVLMPARAFPTGAPRPDRVVDFKYLAKRGMAGAYRRLLG